VAGSPFIVVAATARPFGADRVRPQARVSRDERRSWRAMVVFRFVIAVVGSDDGVDYAVARIGGKQFNGHD
jgi:hypothetical protein